MKILIMISRNWHNMTYNLIYVMCLFLCVRVRMHMSIYVMSLTFRDLLTFYANSVSTMHTNIAETYFSSAFLQ
jgi:hypothetical protein